MDLPETIRIGTRGSPLALWQAERVARRLEAMRIHTELVKIRTLGDRNQQSEVSRLGDKGIFTREIEQALLEGRIDVAVHSLKDLPVMLPAGLALAAVPERASPYDVLVSPSGRTLLELPEGARVGTGSPRRRAQLLALRPDLVVVPLRGNLNTRLKKLEQEQMDAAVMAEAGLARLGLQEHITEVLPPDLITPAMGQGALCVEARQGEWPELFEQIQDPDSRLRVDAERTFVAAVGGACHTPVGVLAEQPTGGSGRLTAVLATSDGQHLIRRTAEADAADHLSALAHLLAEGMMASASEAIRSTFAYGGGPTGERQGLSLILTRPSESDPAMAEALRSSGAHVILAPALEMDSLVEQHLEQCEQILKQLEAHAGWLILPSPAAIRHFGHVLALLERAPDRVGHRIRFACLGKGSTSKLKQLIGVAPAFEPPEPRGASLAAHLPATPGELVVILGSTRTRPELREGLDARGLDVRLVPIYRPMANTDGLHRIGKALDERADRVIVATSPSGVEAIFENAELREKVQQCGGWVAIGSTTRGCLIRCGVAAHRIATAARPDAESILRAAGELRPA